MIVHTYEWVHTMKAMSIMIIILSYHIHTHTHYVCLLNNIYIFRINYVDSLRARVRLLVLSWGGIAGASVARCQAVSLPPTTQTTPTYNNSRMISKNITEERNVRPRRMPLVYAPIAGAFVVSFPKEFQL